jgi:hypothetical protein
MTSTVRSPRSNSSCAHSLAPTRVRSFWPRSPVLGRCWRSPSPLRSVTSLGSPTPASWLAMPAWRRRSTSPGRAPGSDRSPRPAHRRCAGPRSRPPSTRGDRATLATGLYLQTKARHSKANPAKSAVARKVLIACWHVLSRQQRSSPPHPFSFPTAPASSTVIWPPDGPKAT